MVLLRRTSYYYTISCPLQFCFIIFMSILCSKGYPSFIRFLALTSFFHCILNMSSDMYAIYVLHTTLCNHICYRYTRSYCINLNGPLKSLCS